MTIRPIQLIGIIQKVKPECARIGNGVGEPKTDHKGEDFVDAICVAKEGTLGYD